MAFRWRKKPPSGYEPAPRYAHKTVVIGSNQLYMWAGRVKGLPEVHNSPWKRVRVISRCVSFREWGTGYNNWPLEHLHWEWVDIAVLLWVTHSIILVDGVDMMAAIIIVFTSWAHRPFNGWCYPPLHLREGHRWRRRAVVWYHSRMVRRTSCV